MKCVKTVKQIEFDILSVRYRCDIRSHTKQCKSFLTSQSVANQRSIFVCVSFYFSVNATNYSIRLLVDGRRHIEKGNELNGIFGRQTCTQRTRFACDRLIVFVPRLNITRYIFSCRQLQAFFCFCVLRSILTMTWTWNFCVCFDVMIF